jgi:putative ABC transport system permease protein
MAIVATVCAVILATTGQTVQAESAVLARVDDAGTRFIEIQDPQGAAGVRCDAVRRIASLSRVEWVLGLGFAVDGRNTFIGPGGTPVPSRIVCGSLPERVLDLTTARMPAAGEAVVGLEAATQLGLNSPVGSLSTSDGRSLAIVGGFRAFEPLTSLNRAVLVVTSDSASSLRSIYILVDRTEAISGVRQAALALLGADDPAVLSVETSQILADVRAAVAGELGRFSRRTVLMVLGVGLVLAFASVYAAVTARRQHFGRRRALGATRAAVIALVVAQYVLTGIVGGVVGSAVGTAVVLYLTGDLPDGLFTAAVSVLAVLTTGVAAALPAVFAAYRDPVRALRMP